MSVKNGKDYLYLIWHDKINKKQFVIGKLSKNGKFEFEYSDEIKEAQKNGFELLITFPKIEKYESEVLFPIFSSRLPDKRRSDIKEILNKYNLSEYDSYELLKASGAKLPIDNLMFIDPILECNDNITRRFYIAGSRHYMDCIKKENIEAGASLQLEMEPDNIKDKNAIKILYNNKIIGYVPRYYSEAITRNIKEGKEVKCYVINSKCNNDCSMCVYVEINIKA